jgi:hypothetical protein
MMRRYCKQCGKAFQVLPSKIKAGRGQFCKLQCKLDYFTTPAPERFWRFVLKTESCWLWTGAKNKDTGYGVFVVATKHLMSAHRFSWELHNGPIPEGKWVLHDCPGGDNRACVNPSHLFLGTNTDNMRDASRKGTIQHGETHCFAKLTDAQVLEIRNLLGSKSQRKIGDRFGVSASTIDDIGKGRTWRHLGPKVSQPTADIES